MYSNNSTRTQLEINTNGTDCIFQVEANTRFWAFAEKTRRSMPTEDPNLLSAFYMTTNQRPYKKSVEVDYNALFSTFGVYYRFYSTTVIRISCTDPGIVSKVSMSFWKERTLFFQHKRSQEFSTSGSLFSPNIEEYEIYIKRHDAVLKKFGDWEYLGLLKHSAKSIIGKLGHDYRIETFFEGRYQIGVAKGEYVVSKY